ncbi:MAG: hypothetical protein L0K86_18145 [Actinomycetia bacterium]|nr:hypothetical protein [Actinomycetes bacterium]
MVEVVDRALSSGGAGQDAASSVGRIGLAGEKVSVGEQVDDRDDVARVDTDPAAPVEHPDPVAGAGPRRCGPGRPAHREPVSRQSLRAMTLVFADDVERAVHRAVRAGGSVIEEPTDQPWGGAKRSWPTPRATCGS